MGNILTRGKETNEHTLDNAKNDLVKLIEEAHGNVNKISKNINNKRIHFDDKRMWLKWKYITIVV